MSKSSFNRQLDIIRQKEEAGLFPKKQANRILQKFLANRLAVCGFAVFSIILLATIFAPLITPYKPLAIDLTKILQPPSAEHLFGTDKVGRDVFTRILYGGRVSILVGFGSSLGAALIGVSLGLLCGYRGGFIDAMCLRVSEVFMSFPQIILVLLLVTIAGQSLMNLVVIFMITGWGSMYRMARARVLSIREEEYVQALRAFGINIFKICFKHILPNALGPIVVMITLSTAMFILEEAGLSFLGLGVPMHIATWGNIINVAQDITILRENWWIWLPVGIVISLFVLSINFIGDGFRDSADPSQQG
jgi:peptide/nickel transport system permease protein